MTDPRYSHHILIIDRSGSMLRIRGATEAGIRDYIAGIRSAAGLGERATVSLYQFDDRHETAYVFEPAHQVPPYALAPRGMTALLDAIGFAVTAEGAALAALDESERPGKVVAVIATDGLENASREWTAPAVRDLLARQQDAYAWQVTYIGANQDAFAVARDIGVPQDAVLTYTDTTTDAAWRGVATASAGYVSGAASSIAYTAGQVAAAAGEPQDEGGR